MTGVLAALPNPVEWVGEQLGNAASAGAEKVFEFFMTRLAEALANAANKVMTEVMNYLDKSSSVTLEEGWFASPRTKEILQTVRCSPAP